MTRPDLDFWRAINALTMIKARQPELRIAQIISNAAGVESLLYKEDASLAFDLESYLAELSRNWTNK